MNEQSGKVVHVSYHDKNALYQSYMSFCKDGGLFVPMQDAPEPGSPLFLLVTLPDNPQLYPVCGEVVWIANGRKKGAGVRMHADEAGKNLRVVIENILASSLKSAAPTLTM